MTIIISMAGLSQRFINEGFTLPKYMLYIGNKSLFNLSVSSFEQYFKTCKFLFIARDVYDTKRFIEEETRLLGIENYDVLILDQTTKGQAETVYIGLKNSNIEMDESITIFNIDTFHKKFQLPLNIKDWDGYLEVFWGDGNNWSYAKTESQNSTKVIETAEKVQISNYCSTGMYYFNRAFNYLEAYENEYLNNTLIKEQYIAPLYNFLIRNGKAIHIHLIEQTDLQICGVPNEYYDILKQHYENL